MKFQDMPYERIDFAKVQEEMGEVTVKGKKIGRASCRERV